MEAELPASAQRRVELETPSFARHGTVAFMVRTFTVKTIARSLSGGYPA